jgi:hypothetical protein
LLAGTLIVVYVAVVMLFESEQDSLALTVGVFATAIALAGLAFTYASALEDGSEERDEVMYAGEQWVSSAVCILIVLLLKHGSMVVPKHVAILLERLPNDPRSAEFYVLLRWVFSAVALVLSVWGLIEWANALSHLSRVVSRSRERRPQWFSSVFGQELSKSAAPTPAPSGPAASTLSEGRDPVALVHPEVPPASR